MHPVFFCYSKDLLTDNNIYFRLTEIMLKSQIPKRNKQKDVIPIANNVFKTKHCIQAHKIILEHKKRKLQLT